MAIERDGGACNRPARLCILACSTASIVLMGLIAACNAAPASTALPAETLTVQVTIYPPTTQTSEVASDLMQPATATDAPAAQNAPTPLPTLAATPVVATPHPLAIEAMRAASYPGSDLVIERELERGASYRRYIASYLSEGLRINGLLTVPMGQRPASGWPAIIFNHGYIPPNVYRTTERYVAYVDALARSGYIVYKPDYRGHGDSEGQAISGYGDPGYTADVLNAFATISRFQETDPGRMGMWGHSMGGQLTLRSLVVEPKIKAAVIWAGTVAPYPELVKTWTLPVGGTRPHPGLSPWSTEFITDYGSPDDNPGFWASISPNSFIADIIAPVQVHHGSSDEDVPMRYSDIFVEQVRASGKAVEYFSYPGDNHNLSGNFVLAMRRTIEFFDAHLKAS